jgi:hypothetical protein
MAGDLVVLLIGIDVDDNANGKRYLDNSTLCDLVCGEFLLLDLIRITGFATQLAKTCFCRCERLIEAVVTADGSDIQNTIAQS